MAPLIGDDSEMIGVQELFKLLEDPVEKRVLMPFLSGRAVTPAERTAYADFLCARGDVRGELIGLSIELSAAHPPTDAAAKRARLDALVPRVLPSWWAVIRAPRYLLNCGAATAEPAPIRFAFRCPRTFETLTATADPAVRHCESCGEDVHRADDLVSAEALARAGRCLTIPVSLAEPAGYPEGQRMITGRPAHPVQKWAERLFGPFPA